MSANKREDRAPETLDQAQPLPSQLQPTLLQTSESKRRSDSPVAVDGSDLLTPGDSDLHDTLLGETQALSGATPRTLVSAADVPHASERSGDTAARFERRYAKRRSLGTGGMGEVILYRDQTIGREVALKLIRDDHQHSESRMRFLREARVQGQLEHPAIVPVYDLGVDPDGNLYFTMKRLRGMSLDEVVTELQYANSEGALSQGRHRETVERFSRRRLLTLFNSVCLAIHFAHTRGVLHRDLKPANVMVGDFGEVYVLDWGLARVQGVGEAGCQTDPHQAVEVIESGPAGTTMTGSLLGTPGYMSPEQARGRHADLDARSDVYALGALLYELLTLERLHTGERIEQILASTLELEHARFEAQSEVPPELADICRKATARDRNQRYASARELSNAVESFLDGDRDLERRRELSAHHAAQATAHLARVEAGEEDARGPSMREVSAALGLEPENPEARAALVQLLTRPPRELPKAAAEEMNRAAMETHRVAAKSALLVYLGFALYLPFPFWLGLASASALATLGVCILACAALTYRVIQHPPGHAEVPLLHLGMASLTVAVACVMLGPFVIVPTLAMANAVAYVAATERSGRWLIIAASCLAVIVPAVLMWTSVLPNPYSFESGKLLISPWMFELPELPSWVFLLVTNSALVISGGVFVGRLRDDLLEAQRRLQLQAWQLKQIAPEGAA